MGEGAGAAGEPSEMLAESRIKPLDEGRVDDNAALRFPQQARQQGRNALHNTTLDLTHMPFDIALDDLNQYHIRPSHQAGTTTPLTRNSFTEAVLEGFDVGLEA